MNSTKLLLVLILSCFALQVRSQCANNNTFLMNATPPVSPGISSITVNCINGGQYVTTTVIAGNTYTFSTCGNTAFDTQITVLNATTNANLAYNDDGCGVQSTVNWVATYSGTVNVLIDEYPCTNTGLCTDLVITSTPPVQSGNGCNTNTTICTQGVAGPFGFSTPGPPVSTCLDFFGPNYAYIVLYITTSGPLQMLIDGSAATGFLDVAVFDVPPGIDPCVASLNNANQISCNYASSSSGCNQIGTAFPCASSVPSPNVVAGDVLFIVVENWSGTSTNFTLDLGAAPAAQTGPPDGTVNPVGPFCSTAPAVQLTAANVGGTWSGPGVSATGLFTPSAAGLGTHTINYSIGSAPCVGSGSTTITVTSVPTVNVIANQTLCAGAATTAVNFSGSVVGATYNWTNSNPAIGLGASGTGNIASFTATNSTSAPITSTITVTPTLGACTGTPRTFTITVNPTPTVNVIANQTLCAGAATTAVTFGGNIGTTTYNWTNSNPAIGLGASGAGNIASFTATNATTAPITATITVTPTVNGCPGTPRTFTYTVNPTPTVNVIANQTLCAGAATTAVTFGGNIGTTTYNWVNSNTGIGLGASGSGNIASFTATNATAAPITATITVTPTVNGCPGTPRTFTITVNPTPTVNVIANQTLCAGAATTAVTFGGNIGTTTYNWTNSNPAIGLGASGAGNIASFTATNATTAPITATITVTPTVNGCPGTPRTFTYTVNPIPTVNVVANQTLCAGAATTAVTFGGNIGTTTYNWTNSNPAIGLGASGTGNIASFAATNAATAPITATITVTPTVNGCPGTPINFTITVNPIPTVNVIANQTLCTGATTAAVTFGGNIGTTTYNWTNSNPAIGLGASGAGNIASFTATNATTAPITATITVTPTVNGCPGTPQTFTITVSPLDNAGFTTTNYCQGSASPAATITGSAGGTFSFNPVPGGGVTINAANGSITGGVGGTTYTVQYTTSGTCPQTSTQPVTVYALPTVTAADVSVCTGGSVDITANGATSYSWDNGLGAGQTHTVTPAITTTYTVTGTSANGCVSTDVMTVTLVSSAPINAGSDVTICAGSSTTLVGTGGVSYTWAAPISAAGASQTVSPAITTTYTVDGVDASGCIGSDDVTVTVNPLPTVNVVGNQTLCANLWTAGVNFSGSIPATTFNWVNNTPSIGLAASGSGNIASFAATNATSAPITATITVTPTINGCTGTPTNFTITVNPIPTVNPIVSQTLCANNWITPIVFGGNMGTASYDWVNTNTAIGLGASGTSNGASFLATNTSTNSIVGTISVTPWANGCAGTLQSFTMTVDPLPTATISGTATVCVGAGAPSVTFTGANGIAPYTFTYNINGGANQTVTSVGATATVLAPTGTSGVYNYNLVSVLSTVSGCTQNQTGTASITVNPSPTATIAGTAAVCQNGTAPTITFTGANGTAPYTFTYTVNGGANQTITSVGTTATVTAPTGTAGTFNYNLVSVAEGSTNACSQAQIGTATITVNPLPTASIAGSVTVCQNAATPTLTITGANGTAPYTFTYNINGGANQTITSVGATATISAPTGTSGTFAYNLVSVSDASSTACSQTQTGTATVIVNPLPTATIAGTVALCQNAPAPAVTFTGANGTAPYTFTYNINGGANQTVVSAGATATVTAPTSTVGVFNYNLVSVADASAGACSQAQTGTITVTINPLPTATVSGTIAVCEGSANQTITFTGANGTAPYTFTYNINGGASQTIVSVGNTATVSASAATTGTFNYNLVSVADASATGCSQAQVGTATVTVNPLPTATIAGTAVVCQNDAAPSITFTGANGTAPYTFTYTINGGPNQTVTSAGVTATVSAPTGTVGSFDYTLVSVVDGSSTACAQTQTGTVTITVNPLPTATISGTTAVCLGDANPTITLTGANGVAPYTFTYNVNNTGNVTITSVGNTATISVPTVVAGAFNFNLVSVIDATASGCIQAQTGTAIITVNDLPNVSAGSDIVICEGNQAVLSGSGAATYVWSPAQLNGVAFTPASSGVYTVTGTDANGCVNTDDVTITLESVPVVSFIGDNLSGCAPLTVTFTNTTAGVMDNCTWTFENGTVLTGCGSVTTTFNASGMYDVTLETTTAAGCTASTTYTDYVYVEANPVASFIPSSTSVTNINPQVYFENTSSGAVNYVWDFGNGSTVTTESPIHVFPGEEAGTYGVELIAYSALGCTDTAFMSISVTEEVIYYIPNTFTPDDDIFNPTFQPVFTSGFDPFDYTLLIFDRWGEIIFESHNAEVGWNGTYNGGLVQDGTYTWKIEFKTTLNDERKVVIGHVNLIN